MLESEEVRKMLIQSNGSPHLIAAVDSKIGFHLGLLIILFSGSL